MARIEIPQFVDWRPSGAIGQVDSRSVLITDLSDRLDDPLKLLERLAQLDIYQDHDTRIYSLSLPSLQLIGKDLMRLMSATRPDFLYFEPFGCYRTTERVEYEASSTGILADSGILKELPDGFSKSLVESHEAALGPYWHEFAQVHVDQFSQAVKTWSKSEYVGFFKHEMGQVADRDYVIENLGKVLESVACHLNHRDHPAYFLRDHYQDLREYLFGVDQEYLNSYSFFCKYDEFVSKLSRDVKKRLVQLGILKRTKTLVDLNSEPGIKIDYPYEHTPVQSRLAYLGNAVFEINIGDSCVMFRVDGTEQKEISMRTVIDEAKAMIPRVLWARRIDGQRVYLSGELPDVLNVGRDVRENSLLGLLLVTYLYDDLRKSLGEEWSFQDAKFEQRMMEAQMPLLASVFRDKILEAPIFDILEEVGESSVKGVA